jgi:hypothetical protein
MTQRKQILCPYFALLCVSSVPSAPLRYALKSNAIALAGSDSRDFDHFLVLFIDDMHRAGEAGVE